MTELQIIILACVVAAVALLCIGILLILRHKKHKNTSTASKQELPVKPIQEEMVSNDKIEETLPPLQYEEPEEEESFLEEEQPENVVQIVNGKQIFVQYNYSFKAKLILSTPEVQAQYQVLLRYVKAYGIKTSISWKQERIYLGRNTYAMLVFKGKKLCVAYALNPKDYLDTKYRIIDLSEIKRFMKTPTLIKISSERKVKYALELFDILFEQNGLQYHEQEFEDVYIPKQSKEELIEEHLIKVYTSDTIEEGAILKPANVEDIIRKNITIEEARTLLTDDSILEYVDVVVGGQKKSYTKKDIINVDTLSKAFQENDLVNLETLKEKKLISSKVDFIKILGRGVLDKPLIVEAQDYSLDALKMIILTGGEARKI